MYTEIRRKRKDHMGKLVTFMIGESREYDYEDRHGLRQAIQRLKKDVPVEFKTWTDEDAGTITLLRTK